MTRPRPRPCLATAAAVEKNRRLPSSLGRNRARNRRAGSASAFRAAPAARRPRGRHNCMGGYSATDATRGRATAGTAPSGRRATEAAIATRRRAAAGAARGRGRAAARAPCCCSAGSPSDARRWAVRVGNGLTRARACGALQCRRAAAWPGYRCGACAAPPQERPHCKRAQPVFSIACSCAADHCPVAIRSLHHAIHAGGQPARVVSSLDVCAGETPPQRAWSSPNLPISRARPQAAPRRRAARRSRRRSAIDWTPAWAPTTWKQVLVLALVAACAKAGRARCCSTRLVNRSPPGCCVIAATPLRPARSGSADRGGRERLGC